MNVKIGTWHEEGREITRCPGYYAADSETLKTIPGDVDAFVDYVGGYNVPMPYWLVVSIPATRLRGTLYSGFGGVNFASTELKKGEAITYGMQGYRYHIKQWVAAGRLTLDERFSFLMDEKPWDRGLQTWDELKALVEAR